MFQKLKMLFIKEKMKANSREEKIILKLKIKLLKIRILF